MPEKPTYLGLLNAIANGEMDAHAELSAWASVTKDDETGRLLRLIARREAEHGAAFAARIDELGFEVRRKVDPKHEERLTIAASARPDLEKMDLLGIGLTKDDEPDGFDGLFRDRTIDSQSGALLGRYIAEERDTARLTKACRARLEAEAARGPSTATDERLSALEEKVDGVLQVVEEIRGVVRGVLDVGRQLLPWSWGTRVDDRN